MAFHSSNESSNIGYAYSKEKTKIEDENLIIFPGHENDYETNSHSFFAKETLFEHSYFWIFPCGSLCYIVIEKVSLTRNWIKHKTFWGWWFYFCFCALLAKIVDLSNF